MKNIMKFKVVGVLAALLLLLLTVTSVSYAKGNSPDQLLKVGWWNCVVAGPNDWVHCIKEDPTAPSPPASILVKIFDENGDKFLGTEKLMRPDLYDRGKPPCPQEGVDEYELVQIGPNQWRACHHF